MHEIEKYCNDKWKDLNFEHEARVKSMEEDHEKSMKMLRQPPSQPTRCDQSNQTLSVKLSDQSQQTASVTFLNQFVQTPVIPVADQSLQVSVEELGPDSSEVAAVAALQIQVEQLKKKVAELMFENNRCHLSISNCTFAPQMM